jgi:hypothetical protein
MRDRGRSALIVLIGLAFGLSACGGGSKGLSKAQLDAKANAICKTAEAKLNAIPQPTNAMDPKAVAAYFDKVQQLATDMSTRLDALKPASDVKSEWESFIALDDQAVALFSKIRHEADTKDPSTYTDLTGLGPLATKVDAAAAKAGVADCGGS